MKNPYLNAAIAATYILGIVTLMTQIFPRLAPEDNFLAPVMMLSLLVLSVALMALLFFARPVGLIVKGSYDEAIIFFLRTLGTFVGFVALVIIASFLLARFGAFPSDGRVQFSSVQELDPTTREVTLSGTYQCLPYRDTRAPHSDECIFGIKTDDGVYYMVNFGQSASAMQQFKSGAHVRAEGFTVIKEALNTDHWDAYDMEGIFTITHVISAETK